MKPMSNQQMERMLQRRSSAHQCDKTKFRFMAMRSLRRTSACGRTETFIRRHIRCNDRLQFFKKHIG